MRVKMKRGQVQMTSSVRGEKVGQKVIKGREV